MVRRDSVDRTVRKKNLLTNNRSCAQRLLIQTNQKSALITGILYNVSLLFINRNRLDSRIRVRGAQLNLLILLFNTSCLV